jgi:hypothetical protein
MTTKQQKDVGMPIAQLLDNFNSLLFTLSLWIPGDAVPVLPLQNNISTYNLGEKLQ